MVTMAVQLTGDLSVSQPRVLIADDQPDVLEALRLLLKGHGYVTEAVSSPASLLDAATRCEFDVILMDLNYARDTTSGREGLDLLAQLQKLGAAPPIVVMTGWATVGLAVEAMQRGVGDFVEKPWSNSRRLEILKTQIQIGRERRDSRRREDDRQRERDEMALRSRRQEREIQDALVIQKGLLPTEIPQIRGYRISTAWQPARTVGGDYYDVLDFGAGSVGICIADVAGKGLPAAMLMSNLQAAVRGLASPALPPEQLCQRLDAVVRRNMAHDRFITLFYAQLDGPGRKLSYANAGHNAPIVVHSDGSCDHLRDGAGVLGAFESQSFIRGVQELLAGDRLVFFTDGITEASNPTAFGDEAGAAEEDEFGDKRLRELVTARRKDGAEELQAAIMQAVAEHCAGQWSDDATLIVIEVE
jgi:phosphoserine phosphatase RsbU/P